MSLPDDLFRVAEATARRLHVSRSELYARAIEEFLKSQRGNTITDRLNDIYSRRPAKVDSGLQRAQVKSLDKDALVEMGEIQRGEIWWADLPEPRRSDLDTGGRCLWSKQTPSISAGFKL